MNRIAIMGICLGIVLAIVMPNRLTRFITISSNNESILFPIPLLSSQKKDANTTFLILFFNAKNYFEVSLPHEGWKPTEQFGSMRYFSKENYKIGILQVRVGLFIHKISISIIDSTPS